MLFYAYIQGFYGILQEVLKPELSVTREMFELSRDDLLQARQVLGFPHVLALDFSTNTIPDRAEIWYTYRGSKGEYQCQLLSKSDRY